MEDKRLKELMESVGMPNSRSLKSALEQAYSEGEHAQIQRSKIIMSPRFWSKEQMEAWHRNIPSIQTAFDALVEASFWGTTK